MGQQPFISIEQAKQNLKDLLWARRYINGIGISVDNMGKKYLIVMADYKLSNTNKEFIPKEIDGFEVKIETTGPIFFL